MLGRNVHLPEPSPGTRRRAAGRMRPAALWGLLTRRPRAPLLAVPVEDLVRDPPAVVGLHQRERIREPDFGTRHRPALGLEMHNGDALVDVHAREAAFEVG